MGAKSTFTQKLGDTICARVSKGEPLSAVCRDLNIGRVTVHNWRHKYPKFMEQFARAKDDGYDAIADQVMEIADDARFDWVLTKKGAVVDEAAIGRSRLMVEARLKLLAKWDPARYGDRIIEDKTVKLHVTVDDPTIAPQAAQAAAQSILEGEVTQHAPQTRQLTQDD